MTSQPPSAAALALRAKLLEIAGLALAIGVTFLVINWLHFQFLPVSVILYACVLDTLVASAIVLGLLRLFWSKRTGLMPTETGLTVIAANLLVLLYAVMGPTVIDRSLSIYIVEKIEHRGGAVAEAAMPEIILKEFMQEYRVSDVRMTEQVTSGTVKIEDGCIRLSARGRMLSSITRFFRMNFLPKRRIIGDEITDALTRPYQDAPVLVPYECVDANRKAG